MSNFKHSPEDYKALTELGIPNAEINGYQVTDGDEQALREFYNNRLEQGYEIPEEYQPNQITRAELEQRYQELSMFETEGSRVNKDDSNDISIWERNGYDDSELSLDTEARDYVPDWVFNTRREKERQENGQVERRRKWSKKRKNDESSKKLVNMLNERQKRQEEKRKKNIEESERLVEELRKKKEESKIKKSC